MEIHLLFQKYGVGVQKLGNPMEIYTELNLWEII